jgi:hypothetical protein
MAISRLALSAILAAGLAVGCGKGRTPAYPTEGQLLIGGKPAVNVFVLFHPVNATGPGVLRPSATTDADGKFRLTTYDAYDGAPAGEYVITLLYEPVNSPLFRPKGKPPKVPPEYTKMETSKLRATVAAQPGNVVEPINLP